MIKKHARNFLKDKMAISNLMMTKFIILNQYPNKLANYKQTIKDQNCNLFIYFYCK